MPLRGSLQEAPGRCPPSRRRRRAADAAQAKAARSAKAAEKEVELQAKAAKAKEKEEARVATEVMLAKDRAVGQRAGTVGRVPRGGGSAKAGETAAGDMAVQRGPGHLRRKPTPRPRLRVGLESDGRLGMDASQTRLTSAVEELVAKQRSEFEAGRGLSRHIGLYTILFHFKQLLYAHN